jgi:hypothetical protein
MMGPLSFNPTIWPPVEKTDRLAKGDIALQGDKDRRLERLLRRRQRQEEQNPDEDQFTHQEPEEEGAEGAAG